ncbi:hypothetical protein PoB_004683900 [Plakobranchus ocellatus]|uniref:Uncharacterized protein n=1 Tax=Plakobranchus ocellatus TaxID=259542 RepID=A0AAV4BN75_9GAST|nr:hypothetical protein PoB_004683900 [Plakobranchus ocellatus]
MKTCPKCFHKVSLGLTGNTLVACQTCQEFDSSLLGGRTSERLSGDTTTAITTTRVVDTWLDVVIWTSSSPSRVDRISVFIARTSDPQGTRHRRLRGQRQLTPVECNRYCNARAIRREFATCEQTASSALQTPFMPPSLRHRSTRQLLSEIDVCRADNITVIMFLPPACARGASCPTPGLRELYDTLDNK